MKVEIADRLKTVEEYYFSKKLKEIAEMIQQGISIINLGIGKPDLVPANEVIETLKLSSEDPMAHGYQSYKGIPALRIAIADFYRQYFHVQCSPNNEILPLMGSKEGIMHISMAFLNPGDEVLIPNPGYPTYASAAKLAGAKILEYNLIDENNYQIDLDELDALASPKTKLIWINYPHMPTGTKADKEVLRKLLLWAKAREILIASDTPYSFILNDQPFSILSIEGAKEQCVELNSLSKSHAMSGWRVGMAISNESVINAMLRFKSNMDSGMFKPIQEAAIHAMRLKSDFFDKNNAIYSRRRQLIWQLLDKIDFEYEKDAAGLFVWSRVSDKFKDGESASDYLLEKARVFAPPGMVFGTNGDKYVRWSLCQSEDVIKEACERVLNAMNH